LPEFVEILRNMARHDSDRVVVALVALALDRVDPGNSVALSTLIVLLLEQPLTGYARTLWPAVREVASPLATGTVSVNARATLRKCVRELEQLREDATISRRAAATHLGAMGPRARAAVPVLRRALRDNDRGVRKAAAEALRKIENKEPASLSAPAPPPPR